MPADVPLLRCSGSCLVPGDLPGPGATAAALWQVSCLLAVPSHPRCPRAWGGWCWQPTRGLQGQERSSRVSCLGREGASLLPDHQRSQRARATLGSPRFKLGTWARLINQRGAPQGLARPDLAEVGQAQAGSRGQRRHTAPQFGGGREGPKAQCGQGPGAARGPGCWGQVGPLSPRAWQGAGQGVTTTLCFPGGVPPAVGRCPAALCAARSLLQAEPGAAARAGLCRPLPS